MTLIDRRAARVVLVDRADRTLLLRGGDPARPGVRWWFTPGGGLDPGETSAQGAARELREETGRTVHPADLGTPVFAETVEFSFDGRQYRQEQEFFLYRADAYAVDTAGFTDEERAAVEGHRWWTAAELDATTETVYPLGLAPLLRRVLTAC